MPKNQLNPNDQISLWGLDPGFWNLNYSDDLNDQSI